LEIIVISIVWLALIAAGFLLAALIERQLPSGGVA
jgi:hypothetical protein